MRVDTVPGLQFRYSGGGTMVMQQLLEDVTGTPLRELVRELVLEPLGMSDSDYAQPLPEELHDRAAAAHDEAGRPIEGRWHSYPGARSSRSLDDARRPREVRDRDPAAPTPEPTTRCSRPRSRSELLTPQIDR